jgi:hypothetical protein
VSIKRGCLNEKNQAVAAYSSTFI